VPKEMPGFLEKDLLIKANMKLFLTLINGNL
jgi:hypothetical protein